MAASVANRPSINKPKLLDQVRGVIRCKQYSIRTEQSYVDWIKRFIIYHDKRHPSDMAEEEVAQFLTHLARDLNVAPSTQNQHVKASPTCQERVKPRRVLCLSA
jgi:phage terminase small subunit